MKQFAASLKAAREARGFALDDIADATHVNIRFLEALEHGDFSLLPQAYVRAHIREYAAFIGLDPDETIRSYEQAASPEATRTAPPPPPPPQAPPPPPEPTPPPAAAVEPAPVAHAPAAEGPPEPGRPPRLAVILIVLAGAALGTWLLMRPGPGPDAEEIPFTDVLRETEAAPDTAATSRTAAAPDSLRLGIVVRDTVWILVTADEGPTNEYLFNPGRRYAWTAARGFRLTVGDAGAVDLSLNGRMLPSLGRRGAVVRDVRITRASLPGK